MPPTLTLHAVPPSHPCMTVAAALELKGLEYERVDFPHTERLERMEEIYGEGSSTVPGLLVDGEPVHGSRTILARLEAIEPTPTLYPTEAVREAERWGDEELQDLGRCLPWGAMYFRPESMGTFAGGEPLDPAGTDFAIKFVRATWRYHKITATRLHDDLAGLPAKIAHIEALAEAGVLDGEQPNAADLQIAATIRVLLPLGDLGPLFEGSAAERIALRFFPSYPGSVPQGAYPAGWVPSS
ncbi:MAG TPA: glutathione S-transferase family protein [Solirubrobacteraceae bacterium]|nr:glutathione S-transferase family protein [Solirubrobacteraceae bacterium]